MGSRCRHRRRQHRRGISKFDREDFDVVITDLLVPGVDGGPHKVGDAEVAGWAENT